LVNPESGVAVYEVKDWDLSAVQYTVESGPDGPVFWAAKDGRGGDRMIQWTRFDCTGTNF
jgi:hypothetical protein